MQITWFGHSAFRLDFGGKAVLLDPFFTGNPACPVKADDARADFLLISHGHGDHLGDAVAIAKRTGATPIANYEIAIWLQNQGLDKAHGMQHGGGYQFPFGRLKMTFAIHGSALPDGSNGGNPAGFLLTTKDGKKIYDAADTGLFGDMRLIGEEGIDLAMLPIGDNYTMGPDDALRAVKLLQPKKVFPIHYNTWPPIAQDAAAWAARVKKETGVEAVVLKPGESLEL